MNNIKGRRAIVLVSNVKASGVISDDFLVR